MTAKDLVWKYIEETGYIAPMNKEPFEEVVEKKGVVEAIRPYYERDWTQEQMATLPVRVVDMLKAVAVLKQTESYEKRLAVNSLKKCIPGLAILKYRQMSEIKVSEVNRALGISNTYAYLRVKHVYALFTQEQIDKMLSQITEYSL